MTGLLDDFDLAKDVKEFRQTTTNAVSKVKGETLSAINTTTARLKEGIAIVNAADTKLRARLTEYKGQYIEQLDGVVGALSGGVLNLKDLTKSFKVGKDGISFNSESMLATISTKLGYPVTSKAGAMRKIARDVTKEFNRLTGLNMSETLTVENGKFRVTENWRGELGGEILDGLKDFADIDEFLDVATQSSLYNSILQSVSWFGMSDSYANLWDNYPYEPLRQDAFVQAIGVMIETGDVISIDTVMALLDEQGKNALLNKYPDLIEKLFANFKFDKDALPADYYPLKDKLLALLVRVAGENWMYRETQFGKAYNLGLVSNISDDMVTLLSPITVSDATNEYIPLLTARGLFKEESALNVLDKSFSDSPIVLLG